MIACVELWLPCNSFLFIDMQLICKSHLQDISDLHSGPTFPAAHTETLDWLEAYNDDSNE